MLWEMLKRLGVQELLGQGETGGLPALVLPCS